MKTRWYLFVLWVFLPIAVVLRTLQHQYAIDEAGFYREPWLTVSNWAGYALLLVVLAGLVVARWGCKWSSCCQLPQKNLLLGVGSLFVGVSCIPQVIADLSSATTPAQQFFYTLFISLMGISFLSMGVCHLIGRPIPFLLTALPVVGQLFRLYNNYAHFNGVAKISENVITILFLCSFLVFLLSVCRLYSGLNFHKGRTWALGTGAAAAIFGMLSSVPHWFFGEGSPIGTIFSFGAALYALAVTAVLVFGKAPCCQPAQTELPQEQPEALPIAQPEETEELQ